MAKITKAKNQTEEQINGGPKNSITDLMFFIAINFLAVGVSTYQTFVGYEADVAGNLLIALSIALMSGILFLAMNFEIRKRRLLGQKHILLVIMYIVPLGISFFGNFNAFYANQTGEDFLKNEIVAYKTQLNNSYAEAVQNIESSVDISAFIRNYNSYLAQLDTEFNKPPKGWGKMAQQRWVELTKFLNEQGGNIQPTIIEGTKDQIRFNRALSFVNDEKDNILDAKNNKIKPILSAIQNKYAPVSSRIDSLVNLPKPVYRNAMLDDLVEAENYVRIQTSSFLGNDDFFSRPSLRPSAESGIGTIKHTLRKAFVEREEPSATFFSLFFSLIIDLAALLYILVFIPYKKQKRVQGNGRINQGPQMI